MHRDYSMAHCYVVTAFLGRDTVMAMMKLLDPSGTSRRRKRKLRRRVYRNKANTMYHNNGLHWDFVGWGPTPPTPTIHNIRHYNTQGPNEIWHIDGYDKLSPYGLTIHGCIDGLVAFIPVTSDNIINVIVC